MGSLKRASSSLLFSLETRYVLHLTLFGNTNLGHITLEGKNNTMVDSQENGANQVKLLPVPAAALKLGLDRDCFIAFQ